LDYSQASLSTPPFPLDSLTTSFSSFHTFGSLFGTLWLCFQVENYFRSFMMRKLYENHGEFASYKECQPRRRGQDRSFHTHTNTQRNIYIYIHIYPYICMRVRLRVRLMSDSVRYLCWPIKAPQSRVAVAVAATPSRIMKRQR